MGRFARLLAVAAAVAALVAPAGARAQMVLLNVDDGDRFYTANPALCTADTDTAGPTVQARRHWHVGVPMAGAEAEPAGGFGCLGGPKTYTVTVTAATARVTGRIRYTWDTNVPGGCCNDVHLHAFGPNGEFLSTLQANGPQPIVPFVTPVREHVVDMTLTTGTWTLREDVFSGEHTAWLTRLLVTE